MNSTNNRALQPLDYRSVEHVLEEVRAMRVRGGSAFGQAAATAFLLIARDESLTTRDALFARLDNVADALLHEKPTMATIHNARWLIVEEVRQREAGKDLPALRAEVVRRANLFLRHSRGALEELGKMGARLVEDGQTIMMHSFSESVMALFSAARREDKTFRVICTESRPLREGRFSTTRLASLGVPVTFITDAAMAEMVPEADWVVVGADAIRVDGSVANKMGSNLLSILAAHYDRPFYVASELLKLNPRTRQGIPITLEQRPASEVVGDEFSHMEQVAVRNQFFDLTPASRITMLITEQGLYAPSQVGQAWRDLEQIFHAAPPGTAQR
jgi:eIF-2B alpha/beta/delta-like uncharacterized protein